MIVTVAICTWNRAELLDQTLRQMRHLRIPEGVTWELLIVNNNCTDHTDAVIARHEPHLPIRRLFEPKQGHSHARNCAVEVATGELILWTDDDVLVDQDWLAAYVAASGRWPDAAYFGGRIDPWYEVPPPRWIVEHRERLEGMLVIRDLGDQERPFAESEQPWGASMAFRRRVLEGVRFDPNLGRRRDECILGDETRLLEQLHRAGHYGVYVGTARVRHYIPGSRLTARYLWNWSLGYGRTVARMMGPPSGRAVLGCPLWAIRIYAAARLTTLIHAPFRGSRWVRALQMSAWARGVIEESRYRARPKSTSSPAV